MRSESSKTAEERRKMLELLKHFEEETIDEEILGSDDADDDDETASMDLTRRIGSLDLGKSRLPRLVRRMNLKFQIWHHMMMCGLPSRLQSETNS